MYRNLNAAALGISGRQSELIELALTYGFRGLDLDMADVVKRARSRGLESASRFISSANIQVGGFTVPIEWQGDQTTFDSALVELKETAEIASQLGATNCRATIEPASNDQPYHENFEFHRQRLGEIADVLAGFEMRLGIGFESAPVHRANKQYEFIHQAEPLLTLMKTIGVANVGIVLDTWHWHVGGGASDQLSELSPDQIISVRIADLPGDADLTLVDLAAEWKFDRYRCFTKAADNMRAFHGRAMKGKVLSTLVRGTVVYHNGEIMCDPGHGRLLRPNNSNPWNRSGEPTHTNCT